MHRFTRAFWGVVDLPFKFAAVGLITTYRYTLSAFAGRTCRHLPSCSEYTAEAIWRFGFWPGGWMGLARFSRCRPGGTHGYDPVPAELPFRGRWYRPWRYGTWRRESTAALRADVPGRRTDAASRHIRADPQRIFAALLDPVALASWLPPAGMSARIEHFEAKPGGAFRMILTYADPAGARPKSSADADVVEGRFLELLADQRVVQELHFHSDDPDFAGAMIMHWLLEPAGGGTQVTILAEDVPPGITAEDHDAGLRSSLANLARYVE